MKNGLAYSHEHTSPFLKTCQPLVHWGASQQTPQKSVCVGGTGQGLMEINAQKEWDDIYEEGEEQEREKERGI